jgi:hypothetical protein
VVSGPGPINCSIANAKNEKFIGKLSASEQGIHSFCGLFNAFLKFLPKRII